MPELLENSISGNEALLFAVALFFSAISGQKMEPGQRVALVYAYCLLISYFSYVDFSMIFLGSVIVLFLIFEVFSSDKMLVHLFSFKYKLLDFLYRLVCEFYGWFFYILLFISTTTPFKDSFFIQCVFLIFVILLVAITSKRQFASKTISDMIEQLKNSGGDHISCPLDDKDYQKLEILIFMEDKTFLERKETTHIITAGHLFSRLISRIRENGSTYFKNRPRSFESARQYIRGYGTIEMQIIRNIGLDFGSYRLTIRRKLFEFLFSQTVFNSYIHQLSKDSIARNNVKFWILWCYLNLASVKIGAPIRCPKPNNSTFKQLFAKEFKELTKEEFFVWCLGLPHYRNGVGENAVSIHNDAVEHFKLRKEVIYETIKTLRT